MESKEFLFYIAHPTSVNADSLKKLEETLKDYPYFQSAQLLYAFNLYMQQHPGYPSQLKRAASFASDRKRLKALIDQHKHVLAPPTPDSTRVKSIPPPPPPPPPPSFPPPPPLPLPVSLSVPIQETKVGFTPVAADKEEGREVAVREKLLDIVHRRLAEIARENGGGQFVPLIPEEKTEISLPRISFSVGKPRQLSKEELVEKFIREEPKMSSPRTAFLKPNIPVVDPDRDDDEIVSETLAILYYKQGNLQKAIKVYEKLRLLFPEKSGYFAARMEELKKADASGAQGNGKY